MAKALIHHCYHTKWIQDIKIIQYTTERYNRRTPKEIEDIDILIYIFKIFGVQFIIVGTKDTSFNNIAPPLPLTKICVYCKVGCCDRENLICPCTRKCNTCNKSVLQLRYKLICNNQSCSEFSKPQYY
jgi:hypothetical protein